MNPRARARGFTLMELLVVMAILIMLTTLLIGALWPQKEKAMTKKTEALLKAVQSALDMYHAEFHDYPPDGYDSDPTKGDKGWTYASGSNYGIKIQLPSGTATYFGSGCLIYFLCYPMDNIYYIGADAGAGVVDPRNKRAKALDPYLSTLRKEDISVSAWDDSFDLSISPRSTSYKPGWSIGEIIDAFGFPIHYDKVRDASNGGFFQNYVFEGNTKCHSDQTYLTGAMQNFLSADVNGSICPTGAHNLTSSPKHGEPRSPDPGDGCYLDATATAPRNPGAYDLWAHGKSFCNGRTAITNWR
jgi:general secretion pathway protein G